MFSIQTKILLSRFVTRAGDQAWDFAIPITLATLFPENLALVAFIYLLVKILTVLLLPVLARSVDRWPRQNTVLCGVAIQFVGIVLSVFSIWRLGESQFAGAFDSAMYLAFFAALVIGASLSTLGSQLMDITVGTDWVPVVIPKENLALVNSRVRRLDLLTEVGAPIVAGLIFSAVAQQYAITGLIIIAIWNLLSFGVELSLLKNIFQQAPELKVQLNRKSSQPVSLLQKIKRGWQTSYRHPVFLLLVASAFLWLSALSPHGVLLTSFLKGSWKLSEFDLGLFRGLAAVFGVAATVLYSALTKRVGHQRSGKIFLTVQMLSVGLSLPFFYWGGHSELYGWTFLSLLLVSRVGLYGFGLAELEFRQRMISEGQRGLINGLAQSMTTFATLVLFAMGSLLANQDDFHFLVVISFIAVVASFFIYLRWCAVQQLACNNKDSGEQCAQQT